MFPYIPSLITVILAILTIGIIYNVHLPLLVVGIAIVVTLIFVVNNNLSFFSTEYSLIMSSGSVSAAAPYIMIGTLILFCLLYIFMLKGSGQSKGNSSAVSNSKNMNNVFGLESLPAVKNNSKKSSGQASSILEKIV